MCLPHLLTEVDGEAAVHEFSHLEFTGAPTELSRRGAGVSVLAQNDEELTANSKTRSCVSGSLRRSRATVASLGTMAT